jgi:hypothetical protein
MDMIDLRTASKRRAKSGTGFIRLWRKANREPVGLASLLVATAALPQKQGRS